MYRFSSFLIIICILLIVFVEFFHPIHALYEDLGRHIKVGEIIFTTGTVPNTNLFSFTYPSFTFINTHWLSEVIFYVIFHMAGFKGLLIFTTLIVMASFLMILLLLIKKVNHSAIFATGILYLTILFLRTQIRPEIFSILFLSIFITILYKYKNRFTKLLFLLPFIELLWVNMHIYFIIGPAVMLLFLFDDLIQNRKELILSLNHKKNLPKKTLILICVFFISLAMMLINPHGLSHVFYPFIIFDNYSYTLIENQNIFVYQNAFHHPSIILLEITIILYFTLLFVNLKKTKIVDWLLGIFFSLVVISAERNIPLFVFGTLIPFTRNVSDIFSHVASLEKFRIILQKPIAKVTAYLCVLTFTVLAIIIMASHGGFGWEVPRSAEAATDFFIQNKLKGPIYNNFEMGSYLIYRLYPKEKVFVDGRPEAYPAFFSNQVDTPLQEDPQSFQKTVDRYHFNAIIFSHTANVARAETFITSILANPEWKLIYLDDYAFIMIKNTKSNKAIIDTYEITRQNYKLDNRILTDKEALIGLTNFFAKAKWQDRQVQTLETLLEIDPFNCQALAAHISLTQTTTFPSIYTQRYQANCNSHSIH